MYRLILFCFLMLLTVSCQHPQPTTSLARERIALMQLFPQVSPADALMAYPDLTPHDDELRLRAIYCSAFARGFREAWDGHMIIIETAFLVGQSTDPEGDWEHMQGHYDGQEAGRKARYDYEIERARSER